jgi:transposase
VPDAPVPDDAAGLRAANARLRALLADRDAELEAQVADLAARVGMNSQNSSRPPSSDGLAKPAPKSLRAKSGRKPGRPNGQPGVTMQLSDSPDHGVRHEPSCCSGCAARLGGAPEEGVIRRQVTEIPEARAEVTEHQVIGRRCGCGSVTWADAPDGVTAPAQYEAARGGGRRLPVARAVPVPGPGLRRDGGPVRLRPVPGRARLHDREDRRGHRPGAGRGPAGFRVAGRLAWVHSASSGKYALVTVHEKRRKDGMDAAGVLPAFGGIACHDAWAPYGCYSGVAGRALCGAHVLRELAAVTETGTADDVIWARHAIDALLSLKKAAGEARAAGHAAISPQTLDEHSRWFREASAAGIALNADRRTAPQKKRRALGQCSACRPGPYRDLVTEQDSWPFRSTLVGRGDASGLVGLAWWVLRGTCGRAGMCTVLGQLARMGRLSGQADRQDSRRVVACPGRVRRARMGIAIRWRCGSGTRQSRSCALKQF